MQVSEETMDKPAIEPTAEELAEIAYQREVKKKRVTEDGMRCPCDRGCGNWVTGWDAGQPHPVCHECQRADARQRKVETIPAMLAVAALAQKVKGLQVTNVSADSEGWSDPGFNFQLNGKHYRVDFKQVAGPNNHY